MSYKKVYTYESDKPILAFSNGNYFAKSITVVGDDVPLNKDDRRVIPSGFAWATTSQGDYRPLPRGKATQDVVTTTTDLFLSPVEGFKAGDALYIAEPHVKLTVTAVTPGQTQSITVNGATVSVTSVGSSTDDLVTALSAEINGTYPINAVIYSVAVGSVLWIFPRDGRSALGVTEGGTATATLNGAVMAFEPTSIGTISYVESESGKVVLLANAALAIPAGVNIGAPIKDIVGFSLGSMDFSTQNRINVALLTASSGVRIEMLPYFEEGFREKFPKIRFDYNI